MQKNYTNKILSVLVAENFVGCSPFSALPEEAYQHIARQVEYSEVEAEFVEELAMSSKKGTIFNALKEKRVEAFIEDHAQAQADLAYYFSNDQIVGFYPDEYSKWEENAAFYRDRLFREKDFIAINLDRYEEIDPSVLMHEAGHILAKGHSSSLDETHVVVFDARLAQVVIQEEDYPYLLTFLYHGADVVLKDPHDYATRVIQSYYADVQNNTMTPQKAYGELTLLIQKSKEEWVQEVLESDYPTIAYTNTFGWSEEEFADALKNSGMFEYQQDVFLEYICNFAKEYPEVEAKECQE